MGGQSNPPKGRREAWLARDLVEGLSRAAQLSEESVPDVISRLLMGTKLSTGEKEIEVLNKATDFEGASFLRNYPSPPPSISRRTHSPASYSHYYF